MAQGAETQASCGPQAPGHAFQDGVGGSLSLPVFVSPLTLDFPGLSRVPIMCQVQAGAVNISDETDTARAVVPPVWGPRRAPFQTC